MPDGACHVVITGGAGCLSVRLARTLLAQGPLCVAGAPAVSIAQSLEALRWLEAQGAQQIYFKYCSTFDSAAQGNIRPVAEALMAALGTDFTIATPAFPDNHRTVFKGHLFVGDALLNESGMQNHPLTPMTDANLERVLQGQCTGKVGLIDYKVVAQCEVVIRERIAQLRAQGVRLAVVDAISNADLMRLGPALKAMMLVTAGSGVAIGLPGNFGIAPSSAASVLPAATGLQAVVSGSCSLATNRQVPAFIQSGGPALGAACSSAAMCMPRRATSACAWMRAGGVITPTDACLGVWTPPGLPGWMPRRSRSAVTALLKQ